MKITLKDKDGVILHTNKKYCNEDIEVSVDAQELSIIPSNSEQIEEGLFNKVTVAGEPDLIPENIKKGVNIFGVDGDFDAVDTRDADATANDIKLGRTAYVDNVMLTGTMVNDYNAEVGTTIKGASSTYSGLNVIIKKITGTLTLSGTSASYMFNYCTGLEEFPYLNITGATNTSQMFRFCKAKKRVQEDLDTSSVTNMNNMFYNCEKLEYVPVLPTNKVGGTGMQNMFTGCTSLTDESLNNIMQMCINAKTIYSATYKKLSYLGLTSAQATRCQSLSNYQAFLDAGWQSGY